MLSECKASFFLLYMYVFFNGHLHFPRLPFFTARRQGAGDYGIDRDISQEGFILCIQGLHRQEPWMCACAYRLGEAAKAKRGI
jgi:hypothetical protein